ncbi:P-loop NTPase [Chitinispirillales bacterium ANBcel5]|uniref:P-loop NTPase n=1 Tax=Cellulosispirillum alkaliphilum TaxID=3039283 RepID=UPI002A4FC6FF|nr:P-loop NTPase [Chitinispirillales bacterium ANBcel5]
MSSQDEEQVVMSEPIFISVGGGKGGVGKSTVCVNIGAELARKGNSVGFIDADLGGANLHLCLGVKRPALGLQDFMCGNKSKLSDVAVETMVPGTWLVSGASDFLELANPNFAQKQKIIRNLKKMEADYIFVDLGAGSDHKVTDFYAAFPYSIVVIDGLPTSIENAYSYLKGGVLRGLTRLFPGRSDLQKEIKNRIDPKTAKGVITVDELLNSMLSRYRDEVSVMKEWVYSRKTFLIVNMVKTREDIDVGERFAKMVKKYLSLNMYYVGYLLQSPDIRASIREMKPAVLNENCKVNGCIQAITKNIMNLTKVDKPG